MLKHDTNEEQASQVRVTPEELAAAVAALEARKEDWSGTIAIGDALSELSLDANPDDILREVEVQREQRTAGRKRRTIGIQYFWFMIVIGLTCGGLSLSSYPHTPPGIAAVLPRATTLSSAQEGQQVYVDMRGLKQIVEGTPASQVTVYTNNVGVRWGLIKHGGKTYVQAYTLQATEKALTTKPVVIVNSEDRYGTDKAGFDNSGTLYATVKVTLPTTAFRYEDSEQTPEHAQITVSDVHADSHLWDGFDDRFAH